MELTRIKNIRRQINQSLFYRAVKLPDKFENWRAYQPCSCRSYALLPLSNEGNPRGQARGRAKDAVRRQAASELAPTAVPEAGRHL